VAPGKQRSFSLNYPTIPTAVFDLLVMTDHWSGLACFINSSFVLRAGTATSPPRAATKASSRSRARRRPASSRNSRRSGARRSRAGVSTRRTRVSLRPTSGALRWQASPRARFSQSSSTASRALCSGPAPRHRRCATRPRRLKQ